MKTAIAKDAGLGSASAINVNTYRGVVQLSGFVDSQDKIKRAEEVVRSVEGVQRVENGVKVRPASRRSTSGSPKSPAVAGFYLGT